MQNVLTGKVRFNYFSYLDGDNFFPVFHNKIYGLDIFLINL